MKTEKFEMAIINYSNCKGREYHQFEYIQHDKDLVNRIRTAHPDLPKLAIWRCIYCQKITTSH
jgi:hypothetical protein